MSNYKKKWFLNNKINHPGFEKKFIHSPSNFLNDLDLFTKGQPFEIFDEYRLHAPVHFHEPAEYDTDPGFWSLTRYEDIQYVHTLNNARFVIADVVTEYDDKKFPGLKKFSARIL